MGWASLAVAMNYIHASDEKVLTAFPAIGRNLPEEIPARSVTV